ncbi:DUF305 domain-containing protein [Sphingomonas sp. BN140010]|uniref:DUF305 domain-containing protein n=1 Tax=Sphingomonas arvum TaxID=2992113 RepID=A0ABT3JDS2_9SPHN|nr:DUF305 domain-containing protein [Sphingomonas sp. BN140010]MCW3797218.1 DUF305 domain-containing protein [Sphingomonas sp. BN140010]
MLHKVVRWSDKMRQQHSSRMRSPALAGAALLLVGCSAASAAMVSPADFHQAMSAAMTRMHYAMSTPASADPDREFTAMMIPHHQGAIDMAVLQLRYGKDERLRRLAQGIIVEQQQEIRLMEQIAHELENNQDRPREEAR